MSLPRIVAWFSCGAPSAVASKIAVEYAREHGHEVAVVNCDVGSEHEDNRRFLHDVEKWIDHPVTVIKSEKYVDTWDVWEKTGWLVGVAGTRCSAELKRVPRNDFQRVDDIQVFGYDVDERHRVDRFRESSPEINLWTPLVEQGITKAMAVDQVVRAGLEIPLLYRLGFHHANCIGCVRGQSGYWNKIRVEFPEVYERMSKLERKLDVSINKSYAGDGKRKRVFLDELDPDAGRYETEPDISCGLSCGPQPVQDELFTQED